MYLLREQLRDFTKDGFNPTAQPLLVIMYERHITPLRVTFAPDKQTHAISLCQLIFPFIISVGRICRHICPARQRERQVSQPFNIGEAAGKDRILDRQAFDCNDHLDSHPIEVTPFARQVAAKLCALRQSRTIDANVVTQSNGKPVQAITTLHVQLFKRLPQLMKDHINQVIEPRESAREPRTTKHPGHHAGRMQKAASAFKVATKEEHSNNGGGDHFRVRELTARVLAVLHSLEQIVNKTVYCKGTVVHRSPLFKSFVSQQN